MIEKRFQTYFKTGLGWSKWFLFSNGTMEECIRLNKEQKFQYGKKLLNEFRYVEN